MNQYVLAMREQEVMALRSAYQGGFDHYAFEATQATLRAAYIQQQKSALAVNDNEVKQ